MTRCLAVRRLRARKSISERLQLRGRASWRTFESLEPRNLLALTTVGVPDWIEQGPGPITGGQTVGITDNPVTGSINALFAHPTNADILFAGGSDGGVWRTMNATAANPTWTPLTDQFPSISIAVLAANPNDPNEILAGIGGVAAGQFDSSLHRGDFTGALYTTNALAATPTWRMLTDGIAELGNNNRRDGIKGVAVRDNYLLTGGSNGVWRSTDDGFNFDQLSGTGGLPIARVFDLFGDPSNANRFYAATASGIFRTDDANAAVPTWTNVTDPLMPIGGGTNNIKVALHNTAGNNIVYVGVVNNGQLASLTFSPDQGANWTAMDLPTILTATRPITNATNASPIVITSNNHGLANGNVVRVAGVLGNTAANGDFTVTVVNNNQFSLNGSAGNGAYGGGGTFAKISGIQPREKPGSQGAIHFSIVADPTSPNLVFVGGDRQDNPFPNSIGATGFTGNLMRGDRSVAPTGGNISPQWTAITDNFAGGNSGPHADSRRMVFDANGDIIEGDDGGVYRRDNPTSNAGAWTSVNGDLKVAEIWSLAVDTVNNVVVAGFQDTGTAEQDSAGNQNWNQITQGDGFYQAVDNTSIANNSLRYSLGNTFNTFNRRQFDNTNAFVNTTTVMLAAAATPGTALSGLQNADQNAGAALAPMVLNTIDQRLMLIGLNGVYEDNNNAGLAGDIITDITPAAMTGQVHALAYGGSRAGMNFTQIAYVGTTNGQLFVRGEAGGFVQRTVPGTGEIRDIALDPADWRIAYVMRGNNIFLTTDNGQNFNDITANFGSLSNELLSLGLWDPTPAASGDGVLLAGARGGVYRRLANTICPDPSWTDTAFIWKEYDNDLPNTSVQDIAINGNQVVLGTYGRGVWSIADVSTTISIEAQLTITGDGAANSILLQLDPNNSNRILADDGLGNVQSFERNLLHRVNIDALGGNDVIRIDSNGLSALGDVNFVSFLIDADAGGNVGDTIVVGDSGDSIDTTVTITQTTVGAEAGDNLFGECGSLTYSGVTQGTLSVVLGTQADGVGNFPEHEANIRGTIAGTTNVVGGPDDDIFRVSSNAGIDDNGHLDDIDGNLVLQAAAGDNRLIVSDFGGGANPNVELTSSAITGFAPATIFYSATGGNFTNAPGFDGILLRGSNTATDHFTVRSTLEGSTTTIEGNGGDDLFEVASTQAENNGNLDNIRGKLTIEGGADGAGRDEIFINDRGFIGKINYLIDPVQVVNLADPALPPRPNFAGIMFDGTTEFLRLDGTDDVNVFCVRPSLDTEFYIDGNLPAPGTVCAEEGDFLKLDTDTPTPSPMGDVPVEGATLEIFGPGTGRWTFTSPHKDVGFESIEKFNHVAVVAVGAEAGTTSMPIVKVFDADTGAFKFEFLAYEPTYRDGVHVAVADIDQDGLPDIITAPGRSRSPDIKVFNGSPQVGLTGTEIASLRINAAQTYGAGFNGGVYVAAGDINGDGCDDIALSPLRGPSRILVFENQVIGGGSWAKVRDFFALPQTFIGGSSVAIGDLTGDGNGEVLTGSGSGMRATINVFDPTTFGPAVQFPAVHKQYFPFDETHRGGVEVAVGDFYGNGLIDVAASAGAGGRSRLEILDGELGNRAIVDFFTAFNDQGFNALMHVQAGIIDGNELGGLFTFQTADGRSNEIRRWDLTSPHPLQTDLIINRLSNIATPVPSALVTGVTTVAVVAGNLTVTGDNNDDVVTIRGTGVPGQYEVTTLQATTIENGVTGSILIDLGAGNDSLTLDNSLVAGAIQINTGVGHDTVHLGFDLIVSSAGNTMVSLGDGDDVLIGRRIFIGGNQSTDAGAGNDTVAFLGAAAPGNFVLGTSSGRHDDDQRPRRQRRYPNPVRVHRRQHAG